MKLNRDSIEALVGQGNDQLGIDVSEGVIGQWADYLAMLQRWNRVYNLTSVKSLSMMQSIHLYDSLSVATYIKSGHIADIGSGGGLPGIPLAILYPEKSFTLIDSNSKKTRFLRQVVIDLGLSNVDVVHARSEVYQAKIQFGQIISRAFTSLQQFVTSSEHLLETGGEWLAMKGRYPDKELKEIDAELAYTVASLAVPELNAERHLIQMSRKNNFVSIANEYT